MIISYRHRFTFLHCPKTAGTSISLCLAHHLGQRDLYLGALTERREHGVSPNLRARFDAVRAVRSPRDALIAASLRPGRAWRLLKLQERLYRPALGPNPDHPHARQVRDFDPAAWQRHLKFSFVRNPYARLVSLHLYLAPKDGRPPPFGAFLSRLIAGDGELARYRSLADTWPVYTIDDRLAVDFVGRQETFDTDFRELCRRLGLPAGPRLPHAKRAARYDFRSFYDRDTRRTVARLCEKEIDTFGYRFEA